MKKILSIFTIAAIVLTVAATPAFAKEGKEKDHKDKDNRGLHLGKILNELRHDDDHDELANNMFVLTGTVGSTTPGSIVVNVKASAHVPTLTNNLATVNVNSDTKYFANKNQTVTLADVKTGQQVVIQGTVSGTTLTAKAVRILIPKAKGKAFGEVTAKTDTSITIKNSVTGTTQTFTTNADSDVKINGETKTVTDVQVGDKGFVKFRITLSGMVAKVVNLFR